MSERTDKDYLAHIREAVKRTASYTEKMTYEHRIFDKTSCFHHTDPCIMDKPLRLSLLHICASGITRRGQLCPQPILRI